MILKQEKNYMIYSGDFHFEIICLESIIKQFYEREVFIFTQKSLDNSVKFLEKRINKIKNIDWTNEEFNKMNKCKNTKKEKVVFIKGSIDYIKDMNEKIKEFDNIVIIDAFDIKDLEKNEDFDFVKRYNKRVITTGYQCQIA